MMLQLAIFIALLPCVASAQTAPLSQPVGTTEPASARQNMPAPFNTSFSPYNLSLLFPPAKKEEYYNTILRYERDGITSLPIEEQEAINNSIIPPLNDPMQAQDPISFPDFHMTSLLYKGAKSWYVRAGGITITSDNNHRDKPLYIDRISANEASFIWTPQDVRIIPLLQEFSATGELKMIDPTMQHRIITKNAHRPVIDSIAQTIRFTLEPNQFFSSGYLSILEGNPAQLAKAEYFPSLTEEDDALGDELEQFKRSTGTDAVQEASNAAPPQAVEEEFLESKSKTMTLEERFMDLIRREEAERGIIREN